MIGPIRGFAAACLAVIAIAAPAAAQVFTGRIDVSVSDDSGARLPGVAVEVDGPETHTQTTDATGQAHFVNLAVGTYSVKLTHAGFAPFTNKTVLVETGSSTAVDARLTAASTAETTEVSAVTPVVDVRRDTITTNITADEIQNVPNARDPWALLPTVASVYVDRVNVGGSEMARQANYHPTGALTHTHP